MEVVMKKSFSILIVILLTTGSIGTTQTFIRNFGRNFSKKIGLKEAFSSIRPFTSKALNYTKKIGQSGIFGKHTLNMAF